jgi:hypothetical protein
VALRIGKDAEHWELTPQALKKLLGDGISHRQAMDTGVPAVPPVAPP